MSQSHDYYHYSSKSSRRGDGSEIKREERLPPIHHMVGDPFERKASAYDFKDVKRSLPRVSDGPYSSHSAYAHHDYQQRGPTLPPIHSGHSASHRSHSPYPSHSTSRSHRDDTVHHKSSFGDTLTAPGARTDYPESSHGVFQTFYSAKSGELVPVSTSSSPQGILRSSELPDDGDFDPRKKYKCPECGRRFDRPSGLDQHRIRHTGERPFSCPISDCDSTFTVRSNMTRHVRTQHNCEPEDADRYNVSSRHTTYSTSRGSSDKSSPPSSSYYSSSRRK